MPRLSSRTPPRQQRSRDKRDRILATTAALLAEMPYDAIGTKLIAERSGVAVGSLYRYFADKTAIVQALTLRWLDRMVDVLDTALADPPPCASDLVDRVVDAYAEFYRREPGFREVWFGGAGTVRLDPSVGDAHDELLATRLRATLTERYGWDGTEVRIRTAIKVGDHLLNEAFRADPDGSPELLAELKLLLRRYLALE